MSYRFPHQVYEDLPKLDRYRVATHEPMLLEKRFLLSASPEARQRLVSLRRRTEELMEVYPEIVGVGVFGSLLKGYASPDSDVDGWVFTDIRRVSPKERAERRLLGIDPSGEYIRKNLEFLLRLDGYDSSLGNVRLDELFIHGNDDGRFDFEDEAMLFLPCIGRDVGRYRQETIRYMLARGEYGQRLWEITMNMLWKYENAYLSEEVQMARRKLYQFSLKEAAQQYSVESLAEEE